MAPYARESVQESAADRILLTLLALGLMLLAFFVVLTSTATFDQRRMRDVAQSVQATFVPSKEKEQVKEEVAALDAVLVAAVSVLRTAVFEIFAGILPPDDATLLAKGRVDPDRVEVDVPMSAFFADAESVLFPLPVLDKLVAVLNAPPAGYRMELVVRAAGQSADGTIDQARLAALADGLVRRGLATTALSVGTLQNGRDAGARILRFTFLLLNTEDDLAAVRLATAKAAP